VLIGDFIRIKRKCKNWSQEELARGVCAISYLSRIENNKADGSEQIIDSLLSRLQLDKSDFYRAELEQIPEPSLLDAFFHAYVRADADTCTTLLPRLEALAGSQADGYRALMYRALFALKQRDEKRATSLLAILSKDAHLYGGLMLDSLWHYVCGFESYLGERYHDAFAQFRYALVHVPDATVHPELYFNLALTCNFIGQTADSVNYLKACLDIYLRDKRQQDILDCYVLLAGNYQLADMPTQVFYYLDLSLQLASRLNDRKTMTKIYHGFGNYYFGRNHYDDARQAFEASVQMKQELGMRRDVIPTYMMLAKSLYFLGDRARALTIVNDVLTEEHELTMLMQIRFCCFKSYLICEVTKNDYDYLQDVVRAIAYFEANEFWQLAADYSERHADFLASRNEFEKAYQMMLTAIRFRKHLQQAPTQQLL